MSDDDLELWHEVFDMYAESPDDYPDALWRADYAASLGRENVIVTGKTVIDLTVPRSVLGYWQGQL